jgi:hypothetical protein
LHETGILSRDEANRWWTSLATADRDGTFLYGFTAFIVSMVANPSLACYQAGLSRAARQARQ